MAAQWIDHADVARLKGGEVQPGAAGRLSFTRARRWHGEGWPWLRRELWVERCSSRRGRYRHASWRLGRHGCGRDGPRTASHTDDCEDCLTEERSKQLHKHGQVTIDKCTVNTQTIKPSVLRR